MKIAVASFQEKRGGWDGEIEDLQTKIFMINVEKPFNYKSGDDIQRNSHKLESPHLVVGLLRVRGIFPTFSKDSSKLAFMDNEFKAVWVADSKGLRIVYETNGPDNILSPVWNQNPKKDILYVNMGPSVNFDKTLNICAIPDMSRCTTSCTTHKSFQ
ncbi:hypothetical protein ACSBR1_002885 [Camellia fascicularis]